MKQLTLLSIFIALTSVGCGQNYKAASLDTATNACIGEGCGSGGSQPPTEDPRWNAIDLDGTVKAGSYGTHRVIEIDKVNKLLIIKIPVPGDILVGMSICYPLHQLPDADICIEQDPVTAQYYLTSRIPLRYVVKGVDFADPERLPNGKPLPGIPGGELPQLGLNISRTPMYLYLGKGAVGFFVPTPKYNRYLVLDLTFPIKNKSQRKTIGYFAVVASTILDDGGFFLSVVLPPDIQRILDDIIP